MILFRDANTGELCCCDDFSEPQSGIFHVAEFPDPNGPDDERAINDCYELMEGDDNYTWHLDANYR